MFKKNDRFILGACISCSGQGRTGAAALMMMATVLTAACTTTGDGPDPLVDLQGAIGALTPSQLEKFRECSGTDGARVAEAHVAYDKQRERLSKDYDLEDRKIYMQRARKYKRDIVEADIQARKNPINQAFCVHTARGSSEAVMADYFERSRGKGAAGGNYLPLSQGLKTSSLKQYEAESSIRRLDEEGFTPSVQPETNSAQTNDACVPGPRCSSADQSAQSRIGAWGDETQSDSMTIALEAAYCSNKAVEQVAKICEREFQTAGNAPCAQLSASQARQSRSLADEALGSARASSASTSWRPSC